MNKPLKIGLILGGICAISAGIIGGAYALTKDAIKQNEITKKQNALKEIYNDATFENEVTIKDSEYLVSFTDAMKNSNLIGSVYYAEGRNAYGEISLMVGINLDTSFKTFTVLKNTQSYAGTLKNDYIIPVQQGSRNIDDVKCGATYGAKLIQSMLKAAQNHFKGRVF